MSDAIRPTGAAGPPGAAQPALTGDPGAYARADVLRFVAACYCEPCNAFAEERLFESLASAVATAAPVLMDSARRLGASYAGASPEELTIDYTRLFLGPADTRAQPYAAVWLTGDKTLMQESTLAVANLYATAGFAVDDDVRDLPDHVAIELEFLYRLTHRVITARMAGNEREAAIASGLRDRLLSEHLGLWIPPFTAAIASHAATDFYRELGAFTDALVKHEITHPL